MELIIQKSVELGADEITPVEMKRCVVKIDEKSKQKKIERWQDTILNLGSTENLQSAIKVLIGGMGEIIVLCIGALEIIGNNLSIGELVTYNILIGYLLTPVKDIVNLQPL